MALFGFGKSKRDKGASETVLAYLEDLQRTRTPVRLLDEKGKGVDALVQGVDEGAGTCTFQTQGPLVGAAKGDRLDVVFMADSLRIGATTRILETKAGQLVLELPEDLEVRERRSQARARLNPKEGASLTALTSLFEGTGINGTLENVSAQGARVRVEKAMELKGEKKLPLTVGLFSKGQELMVVKLNQVPKCPTPMELSGKVVYLEQGNSGLSLGLRWDKSPPALGSFVSSRASALSKSVPSKTRRRPQAEESPRPAEPRTPRAESAAATEAPATAPAAPAGAPDSPLETPAADPGPPSNPLLKLKKRSRVAVVLVPEPLRAPLEGILKEDGYGRVLVAGTLDEAEACLMVPNLAWVFLDAEEDVGEVLAFSARMHQEHPDCPPVVMAASEISLSLVKAAQGCGVTQLMVKPYGLDRAFLAMMEGLME